jgi:hypothetical protein
MASGEVGRSQTGWPASRGADEGAVVPQLSLPPTSSLTVMPCRRTHSSTSRGSGASSGHTYLGGVSPARLHGGGDSKRGPARAQLPALPPCHQAPSYVGGAELDNDESACLDVERRRGRQERRDVGA